MRIFAFQYRFFVFVNFYSKRLILDPYGFLSIVLENIDQWSLLRVNGCDHVTPVQGIKQGRLADMSVMSRGWGHWGHWGHAHAPAPGPLMSLNVTRCHCDTLIGRERSRDLDTGLWLADVTTMPGAPGATLGLVTLGPSLRVSLDQHNHQVRGEIRSRMKGLFRSENSRPSPKS